MPCEHCGMTHTDGGRCPRIAAIEYHPDGSIKRVEYHALQPAPLNYGGAGGYPIICRYQPPFAGGAGCPPYGGGGGQ